MRCRWLLHACLARDWTDQNFMQHLDYLDKCHTCTTNRQLNHAAAKNSQEPFSSDHDLSKSTTMCTVPISKGCSIVWVRGLVVCWRRECLCFCLACSSVWVWAGWGQHPGRCPWNPQPGAWEVPLTPQLHEAEYHQQEDRETETHWQWIRLWHRWVILGSWATHWTAHQPSRSSCVYTSCILAHDTWHTTA